MMDILSHLALSPQHITTRGQNDRARFTVMSLWSSVVLSRNHNGKTTEGNLRPTERENSILNSRSVALNYSIAAKRQKERTRK